MLSSESERNTVEGNTQTSRPHYMLTTGRLPSLTKNNSSSPPAYNYYNTLTLCIYIQRNYIPPVDEFFKVFKSIWAQLWFGNHLINPVKINLKNKFMWLSENTHTQWCFPTFNGLIMWYFTCRCHECSGFFNLHQVMLNIQVVKL